MWEEGFSDLLSHYEVQGERVLSQTVTGDEPQTQRQSMEGHHLTCPQKMTFKAISSVGKVMDTVFLGCRRGDFGRHYAMWSNHKLRSVHSNT